MGYSATHEALVTLNMINKDWKSYNTWIGDDRKEYFFEIGKEQRDGSITGQVLDMKGYRKGGIKIMPNGFLKSFPHLPKKIRDKVVKMRN